MVKYWDELPDGLTNINPNLVVPETGSIPKPTIAPTGAQSIPKQQMFV